MTKSSYQKFNFETTNLEFYLEIHSLDQSRGELLPIKNLTISKKKQNKKKITNIVFHALFLESSHGFRFMPQGGKYQSQFKKTKELA